jgi:hypothetical protein
MAGYGRGKSGKGGGFIGNLAKLGGKGKKLSLQSDMQTKGDSVGLKKASKQAHKRV